MYELQFGSSKAGQTLVKELQNLNNKKLIRSVSKTIYEYNTVLRQCAYMTDDRAYGFTVSTIKEKYKQIIISKDWPQNIKDLILNIMKMFYIKYTGINNWKAQSSLYERTT